MTANDIIAGIPLVAGTLLIVLSILLPVPYSKKWKISAIGVALCLATFLLAVSLPR